MKKYTISFITFILSFFVFDSFSQSGSGYTGPGKNKNEEEIKKAIADETEAFIRKDTVQLFSFYSDDELTQSVWNNEDGTYTILKGKDQIINSFSFALKRRSPQQVLPGIERTNWFFKHLSEEYIWVNFDQVLKYKDGKNEFSYETRLMKREKSGWKTTATIVLSNTAGK